MSEKPKASIDLKKEGGRVPLGRLMRWYIGLYRHDKGRIGGAIFLALLQSAALVPVPLLFRYLIDEILPSENVKELAFVGVGGLALYGAHAAFAHASRRLGLVATKRVTESLRARLCMQLQQMSLRFHDEEKASELHSRVVLDTERIDVMGNAAMVQLMSATMMFLLSCVLLAYINVQLFLLTIIMAPVIFLTHKRLKPRMREVHRNFRDEMETMNSQINDLLQAIRLVKTFAREDHEQRRAETRFQTVTQRALDMTIFTSFYMNLMNFLTHLTILLVYVLGGYIIIRGSMSVGDLVAFAGMITFMITPIGMIIGMTQMIYTGLASLGPVYTLLHFHDPIEEVEGKKSPDRLEGSIEFDNVSLVYDTSGAHALRDVTVSIRPGETVALVGESGAGKSTFASLVLGFYLPAKGTIHLDGVDITELNLQHLREKIGVVSQDNVLLNTSIRENLSYGRLEATQEELEDAARQANALEFIQQIPEGFDAVVGDRGTRLSGGQRQRLAIARALLKDPQILILDEATSSLDTESEAKIQEALDHLIQERTCLIIAHRLSTVISADRILVLKDGRLMESGTHGELVEKGGEYAKLCQRQFRGAGGSGESPPVRDVPGE